MTCTAKEEGKLLKLLQLWLGFPYLFNFTTASLFFFFNATSLLYKWSCWWLYSFLFVVFVLLTLHWFSTLDLLYMNFSEVIHVIPPPFFFFFLNLSHHWYAICSLYTLKRNIFLICFNEISFIQLTHHVRQSGLIYLSEVTHILSTHISVMCICQRGIS